MNIMDNIQKYIICLADGCYRLGNILKAFIITFVLFILSSCGVPDGSPECVNEDEWGNVESRTIEVHANEQFTYSGIRVANNVDIEVSISGKVDLCSGNRVFKSHDYMLENENNIPITRMLGIDANNPNWQRAEFIPQIGPIAGSLTPMRVRQHDPLSILLKGNYRDRKGLQTNGRGLYLYIGENSPPNGGPNPGSLNSWWYGATEMGGNRVMCNPGSDPGCSFLRLAPGSMCDPAIPNGCVGAPELPANKNAFITSTYPQFFELFDNGTVGPDAGGYSGNAPQRGFLWFKYARTADARGLSRDGDNRFNPWLGLYAWQGGDTVGSGKCFACGQVPIVSRCLATMIFPAMFPACVASSEAACAAAGRLQKAAGDEGQASRKCREHPHGVGHPNHDHWVDSVYAGGDDDGNADDGDNETGDNPNEGGYEIAIGQGCVGTYGEYMNMRIGPSTAAFAYQSSPAGCTLGGGTPPADIPGVCEKVIDGWSGQPVQYLEYQATGTSISMDMRPEINRPPVPLPGYTGPGRYTGVTTTNGELWFEIVDDETSSLHPEIGYYGDNFGSYTVKIRTIKDESRFSDFAQSIIGPIKGMIFGYCKGNGQVDPRYGHTYEHPNFQQIDYNIDEATCSGLTYLDYDGNAHLDHLGNTVDPWQPGIAQRMYNVLVGGTVAYDGTTRSPFLTILRGVLVLYVVIYAFLFMLGMVSSDYSDFIKRLVKLGIVAVLFSPGSWDFFMNHFFGIFVIGMDDLIYIMTSDFTGDALPDEFLTDFQGDAVVVQTPTNFNVFKFADYTLDRLFNKATWIKVAGLLFSSPIGWLYILLIIAGMVIFLLAIFKAIILYLLANLALALLLIVSPIFLTFMLFDRTRGLFDGWVKNLINYTLQPVLVLTALAIFNVFVFAAIHQLLFYRVCWHTVWSIGYTIPGINLNINTPLLNFYMPARGDDPSPQYSLDLPIQFFTMLIFLIILTALYNFVKWMSDLASELVFGSSIGSLSNAASSIFNKMVGYGKATLTFGISAATGAAKGAMAGKTAQGKVARGLAGAVNNSMIKPITKNLKGK